MNRRGFLRFLPAIVAGIAVAEMMPPPVRWPPRPPRPQPRPQPKPEPRPDPRPPGKPPYGWYR
jgi:periplasmic protein TonB